MKALKLIFFAIILALFLPKTFADPEFGTEIDSTYDIGTNGITTVTNNITVTNLKSDVLASSYSLNLIQIDVFDIEAKDETGNLEINKIMTNDLSRITVPLKDYSVGEGKTKTFTISYKTKLVATKTGAVWNVQIPRSQATDSTRSTVNISVPSDFGPEIYVSPSPSKVTSTPDYKKYFFDNTTLADKNISASFGNYQVLNFRIKYQLENPNRFSSNYPIALPPSLKNSQMVVYQDVDPKPQSTYTDADGNYMAIYRLKPKSELEVTVSGSTRIVSKQIELQKSQNMNALPKDLVKTYTTSANFWPTQSKVVQENAKKLYQPAQTVAQNAQNIYKFLIEQYNYDFEIAKKNFVDRLGAEKALENKSQWGCMEFTDAFIALARAMGIPAREINGYAITSNDNQHPISVDLKYGDLLHAWPEFYDPYYGWIQVDPTWGNTSKTDYFSKLDTNHFGFVIKGIKSDYPLPAGTYRDSNNERLVEVDFANTENPGDFAGRYSVRNGFSWNMLKLLQGYRLVNVTNTSKIILYGPNDEVVLPGQKVGSYIKRSDKILHLTDALGNIFSANLK